MERPVVLAIMDGIGIGDGGTGDIVAKSNTPTLDWLINTASHTQLMAHGTAVGLPSDDDMGNSEVGHNALGCGQIYAQGAKLVNDSIVSEKIYQSPAWKSIISNCKQNPSVLHFLGLLSDGNVHSHIRHLFSMLTKAKAEGITTVRIHILLDGRDVPPTSATAYIAALEEFLSNLNQDGFDAKIASGGGRMKITMDRYEANWEMVKLGWETHVLGLGRQFPSAREAVLTYREESPMIDQDLPPFIIAENGLPLGTIQDHDSVILFNFRGDRAIEISRAFEEKHFKPFDRIRVPKVIFAGMLQYDGDLNLPKRFLVSPPTIRHTLSELLISHGLKEFAVSETQKYGHVTFFWNGNRSEKFDEELEVFQEIPSYVLPFEQRPWMKSSEITEAMITALESGQYTLLRCNYPNGDMVGHTGNLAAAQIAVEAVDLALSRLLEAVQKNNAILIVTADHGNADQMLEKAKDGTMRTRTAHSLNPVPFILYDPMQKYQLKKGQFGCANVASTIATLLNIQPYAQWQESIV